MNRAKLTIGLPLHGWVPYIPAFAYQKVKSVAGVFTNLSLQNAVALRDRNTILNAIPQFCSGSSYPMKSTEMLYYRTRSGKYKMAAFKPENTYFSMFTL